MLRPHDLRLEDIMTRLPICFHGETPVLEACRTLIHEDVLAAPVLGLGEPREVSVAALLRVVIGSIRDSASLDALNLGDLDLPIFPRAHPETLLPAACQEMIRQGARRLVVGPPDRPLGVVSAVDVVRAVACMESCNQTPIRGTRTRPPAVRVRDVMRSEVPCLAPEELAESALDLALACGLREFPVVAGQRLVGLVTRRDLLEMCQEADRDLQTEELWSVMSPTPLVTVDPDQPLRRALTKLQHHAALPVVDAEGCLRGLLSRADVIGHYARRPPTGSLPPALEAEVAALVALC